MQSGMCEYKTSIAEYFSATTSQPVPDHVPSSPPTSRFAVLITTKLMSSRQKIHTHYPFIKVQSL